MYNRLAKKGIIKGQSLIEIIFKVAQIPVAQGLG